MHNMNRMTRTSLFFPKELIDALRKLSAKTGAPIAELIRRAVAEYVERKK
jgi:predicted DNA-binding protein